MGQSCHLLILITLWFLLELALPENKICLPTNVKISLGPGLINVTWDCNITKSMEQCKHTITLQHKSSPTLDVSACFFEYDVPDHLDFTIHNGLHAEICATNKSSIKKHIPCTEEETLTVIPEGNENTAAQNFSCVVYNVSIVNCSWTAGTEAPQDTQYALSIRNSHITVACEDYRKDSYGRQVGCVWKSLNIYFDRSYYIQLVGSSKETSIRFFDTVLTMNNYVILDPPRDIKLNNTSNGLEITWKHPEVHTPSHDHCFHYSININGEITPDLEGSPYKTSNLLSNEKVNVSMRAKWRSKSCSENLQWSRWSQPIVHDPNADSSWFKLHHLLIVPGIVTAVALFLLIFLCLRFQIWKRLFPKVPQPTMKFFDPAEQKELLEQNTAMMDSLHNKANAEECICSPISEISQKEQLEQLELMD